MPLKLGQLIIVVFALALANQAIATLVYDGVEKPPGEAVGDATAKMIDSTAWFYESLARWERRTLNGKSLGKEERIALSNEAFKNGVSILEKAIIDFSDLLGSDQKDIQETLNQDLSNINAEFSAGQDINKVLEEYGRSRPKTFRDLVELARQESTVLLNAFKEIGFDNDEKSFRKSAYLINETIRRVIRIGLVVGALSAE